MSSIESVRNVKELRKQLSKGFDSLGDLLIYNIDERKPVFEVYE